MSLNFRFVVVIEEEEQEKRRKQIRRKYLILVGKFLGRNGG